MENPVLVQLIRLVKNFNTSWPVDQPAMSVAIDDDSTSLRSEVEAEYRHEDVDVPDENEAAYPTISFYSWERCC